MWFFIGLIAGTFIGFLVLGILQMSRKGDEIYEEAYAQKKKMIVSVTSCPKDEKVKGEIHNDRIN